MEWVYPSPAAVYSQVTVPRDKDTYVIPIKPKDIEEALFAKSGEMKKEVLLYPKENEES